MTSARTSFCDTVRGGKKICANSMPAASAVQATMVATKAGTPGPQRINERICNTPSGR
jgi:hypothetical protein